MITNEHKGAMRTFDLEVKSVYHASKVFSSRNRNICKSKEQNFIISYYGSNNIDVLRCDVKKIIFLY